MESKDILDSDIWRKPPLYFKVWHYLLRKAQYKDYKGLKRGQLWTSIPEIQEACSYYVGYRKVTPSKKEVWSVLDYLRKSDERVHGGNGEGGMIETTKGTHGMLVTICNFNVYQDPSYYEGNAEKNAKETAKPIRTESTGNNINKEY